MSKWFIFQLQQTQWILVFLFPSDIFQVSDKIHYIVHMQTNNPTISATLKEGCRDDMIALTVTIGHKKHFFPAAFILNGCLFFLSLEAATMLSAPAWPGSSWISTYVENMKCSCCVIMQCTLQNAAAAPGDRSISNEGPRDLWKIDCGRQPLRLIQVLITVVPHDW